MLTYTHDVVNDGSIINSLRCHACIALNIMFQMSSLLAQKCIKCDELTMRWYCATNFGCYPQYTLEKSKKEKFKSRQDHNKLCYRCAMNADKCCEYCPVHPPPESKFEEANEPRLAKEFKN